ncbi:LysR substrate-binding domain-containing protein [Hydrogenophaga sp. OTU3427]|uniref:LysR substrate-binding domain-containing protein n=1 Tax=Hydrogenophaga sp. OTU3427 TaxID=3043856 RepID=UPI00313D8C57
MLLPLVQGQGIVLSSYLSVVHLVQSGQLVAVPFDEAQLQQRRLQLMAPPGRVLPAMVQAFAQAMGVAIERHGKRRLGIRRRV